MLQQSERASGNSVSEQRAYNAELLCDHYRQAFLHMLKEGFTDDKVLQSMIDDMKRTTKVQRDIKVADIFDLSFVKKANDELKASGWKP